MLSSKHVSFFLMLDNARPRTSILNHFIMPIDPFLDIAINVLSLDFFNFLNVKFIASFFPFYS